MAFHKTRLTHYSHSTAMGSSQSRQVHSISETAGALTWLASLHAWRHRVDQEGVWVVVLYQSPKHAQDNEAADD